MALRVPPRLGLATRLLRLTLLRLARPHLSTLTFNTRMVYPWYPRTATTRSSATVDTRRHSSLRSPASTGLAVYWVPATGSRRLSGDLHITSPAAPSPRHPPGSRPRHCRMVSPLSDVTRGARTSTPGGKPRAVSAPCAGVQTGQSSDACISRDLLPLGRWRRIHPVRRSSQTLLVPVRR